MNFSFEALFLSFLQVLCLFLELKALPQQASFRLVDPWAGNPWLPSFGFLASVFFFFPGQRFFRKTPQ